MTSYTLPTPTPAVTAFKRALTQIEQHRSALTVIPAPIVRYQRPKTLVEQIADACYVIAVTTAALAVVTLLTLFLLSALTLEVGRAARRYWYEHNLTQRGLAALLMAGVYGTARVVNLYPAARAAVAELNRELPSRRYRHRSVLRSPAGIPQPAARDRLPVTRCLSHPECPTEQRGAFLC